MLKILALSLVTLTIYAQPKPEDTKWQKIRDERVEFIGKRIAMLQEAQACLKLAQSREATKGCGKGLRGEREGLRSEGKALREERKQSRAEKKSIK